jgi:hypothetical protein
MNSPSAESNSSTLVRRLQRAAAGALLLLGACGGGTELLFVPFFSFGFTGTVNNAQVSMFLKASDDCSTAGTLPATANLSVQGGGASAISGTYDQRSVTITLATPPGGLAAVYDGRFQDRDTLAFTPRGAGAAFTVTRINVGVALPNCP